VNPSNGGVVLNRKAERAVLAVLAQHYPESRNVRQVAIQAGYAKGGGGFRGALSKLRTLGLLVGSNDLTITEAGRSAIDGQWEQLPRGRALLNYWLGQMNRAAERAVLQAVYDAYYTQDGGWIDVTEVAAQTGYEAAGGGFRGALSKLRTLGLIEGSGSVRASDDLFT
jgi:predicted transcriptional regulator